MDVRLFVDTDALHQLQSTQLPLGQFLQDIPSTRMESQSQYLLSVVLGKQENMQSRPDLNDFYTQVILVWWGL